MRSASAERLFEFGRHGEGCLYSQRGQGVAQQLSDAPVEVSAEDVGADPFCVLDPVALTHVVGNG
ncbi:hypothetical protein [Mycobacterium sp. SM1]|uniref:hypothetical protein n=1 Tax=Mycobacterium sp. SM1 TaxID=2816243 RepID=UPI001F3CC618|nr:hypothetical protein [Mycobacterium sp. SM1]